MLRNTLLFSLLMISSVWSLTISDPYEICRAIRPALQGLFRSEIGINDSGDIALVWEEGGRLKLAEKSANVSAFSVLDIPEYEIDFDRLDWCSVDSKGNAQIFWTNDNNEFIVAKRTKGRPYSQLENLGDPSDIEQKSSGEIVIMNADYLGDAYDVNVISKNLETSESVIQSLGEIPSSFSPIYLKNQKEFLFWGLSNGEGLDLYFTKKIKDDEWSEPERVPVAWSIYQYPYVFIDSHENIYILSESNHVGLLSVSRVNGIWSEVETVVTRLDENENAIDIGSLRIEMDSKGNLMAVWAIDFEPRSLCAASKPFGKPWEKPVVLSLPNEIVVDEIYLQADDAGRFVVLWNSQIGWCQLHIQGAMFTSDSQMWSPAFNITSVGSKSFLSSFELRPNGRGAVSYATLGDAFDGALSVVEFSLD